jgi:AraC-like DNA-binding protein/quercetin dioxygenase-like cupin family protein
MPHRQTDHAEIASFTTSTGFHVEVMRTWYRVQEFARHEHPYFTLGLMRRGIGTLWAAGETHRLRRGDVVLIPPGEVHTGGLDTRGGVLSYIALHLPPKLVLQAAPSSRFSTFVASDDRLARQLDRIDLRMAEQKDLGEVEAGIVAALERLVELESGKPGERRAGRGEPRFVQVARAIIDDCYADHARTSLGSLAADANVSAFHLVREFKRATGLSPHQYVIQTRVRRAAELLARGLPISDIAATVGFADQAHLTTNFRRHLGATPASWQRAHR